MRVRAIDVNHDWEFGKGQNDYKRDQDAVVQCINTRLYCFLGDCFYDNPAGIDWFNLLGAKNQLALNLAISAIILKSPNVTGILQLSVVLDVTRRVTVSYEVQSSYSSSSSIFVFDPNAVSTE